jgi:hypothetical protein
MDEKELQKTVLMWQMGVHSIFSSITVDKDIFKAGYYLGRLSQEMYDFRLNLNDKDDNEA